MNYIDVLGIRLTDGSAKEMVKAAWKYMGNGAMNVVLYVSSQILLTAGETPEQKAIFESIDMTVFGEPGVLPLSVENYRERKREIAQNEFLQEFLKNAARNHFNICLISDTQEKLDKLHTDLLGIRDNLQIQSVFVVDSSTTAAADELVNELNDMAPDIIVSQVPYDYLMGVIYENKNFINAGMWLALLNSGGVQLKKGLSLSQISRSFYNRMFKRKLNSYRDDKPE